MQYSIMVAVYNISYAWPKYLKAKVPQYNKDCLQVYMTKWPCDGQHMNVVHYMMQTLYDHSALGKVAK